MNEKFHWMVVGYVSPGAEKWITDVGGCIQHFETTPPLVVVGLAYNPDGVWGWNHGQWQLRKGIEFWNSGDIQEGSTGITLHMGNRVSGQGLAECESVDGNYLILPDEQMNPETFVIKEPQCSREQAAELELRNGLVLRDADTDAGCWYSDEPSL